MTGIGALREKKTNAILFSVGAMVIGATAIRTMTIGFAPCPLPLLIHFNLINDYNYGKSIYNKVCLNRRY